MGERIRLFSSGSFVVPVPPDEALPKTQSLNSFTQQDSASSSQAPMRNSRSKLRSSRVSLQNDHKGMTKAPSQLGVLCHHCSATESPCPKAQQEMSPSLPSLYSLASDLSSTEPLCRICHCCWPQDPNDPLISPCRCSGSLQYVHVSCLMHWLDISSRKLHRPAICELCLYKYKRKRVLKYREIKLPECSEKDVRFYSVFVVAMMLMLLSAAACIVCFHLEKEYGPQSNRTLPAAAEDVVHKTTTTLTPTDVTEIAHKEQIGNVLSTVTLVSAILFFFSFFMAMYAHVKAGLSFCNYLSLCWSSNLDWSIEEYKQSKDSQYLAKLEELRRKLNEKQKKVPDEVEPLRSSVIVID